MGHKIGTLEDVLEIILNFLVVLCLETAVDAAAGEVGTPLYLLCLPGAAALVFYGLRRGVKNLPAFLLLHAGAVVFLYKAASAAPFPLVWQIVFAAVGGIYAFRSIKIRVTQDTDGEGELPFQLACFVAAASFLACSYLQETAGCERLLGLSFVWIFLFLLKQYLGNFLSYVEINRRTAGAMPEKSIFRAGLLTVALYSSFVVAALAVCAKTSLAGTLSLLVRKAGRLLLRLLTAFLLLFAGEEEEAAQMAQMQGNEGWMNELQTAETPVWLAVLDQLLRLALVLALAAGAVWLFFLLVRFLIRGFYGRETKLRQLVREGYVEEEERLRERRKRRERPLPVLGGTPQQRLRRIFRKTVRAACPENSGLSAMTAREIAGQEPDRAAAEWKQLAGLYERARYAEEEITGADVKTAGKLSGRILHTIK